MVIVVESAEEGNVHKVQHPVYFVSEVLSDSKTWYFQIMKLTYALLISSRKLLHYFQSHKIEILRNQDATSKIAKWAVELRVFNLVFKPRTAIKVQTLSDFVAE